MSRWCSADARCIHRFGFGVTSLDLAVYGGTVLANGGATIQDSGFRSPARLDWASISGLEAVRREDCRPVEFGWGYALSGFY